VQSAAAGIQQEGTQELEKQIAALRNMLQQQQSLLDETKRACTELQVSNEQLEQEINRQLSSHTTAPSSSSNTGSENSVVNDLKKQHDEMVSRVSQVQEQIKQQEQTKADLELQKEEKTRQLATLNNNGTDLETLYKKELEEKERELEELKKLHQSEEEHLQKHIDQLYSSFHRWALFVCLLFVIVGVLLLNPVEAALMFK
jgi:hypothetical protein